LAGLEIDVAAGDPFMRYLASQPDTNSVMTDMNFFNDVEELQAIAYDATLSTRESLTKIWATYVTKQYLSPTAQVCLFVMTHKVALCNFAYSHRHPCLCLQAFAKLPMLISARLALTLLMCCAIYNSTPRVVWRPCG
jgi:hypothetical protein